MMQNELAGSQATRYSSTQRSFEENRLVAVVVSTLIELDERGVAWITGTKVKVIEVAGVRAKRWTPSLKEAFTCDRVTTWQRHRKR